MASHHEGTELQPIPNLEQQEAEFQEAPKPKPIDWDRVFAYKSYKVVRIKDRYLGILYWTIVTFVILYIFIFALGLSGKHQYQEPGIGTVITKLHGKGFVDGQAYDNDDLRFPEVEPWGAFIMTKVVSVKNQKIGTCVDYDNPCPCAKDATCVDGFCQGKAWCPSLGEGNALSPESSGGTVTTVTGLQHMVLKLLVGIAFPGIGNYFYVAGKSYRDGTNTPIAGVEHLDFMHMPLGTLLEKANPPVKLEEVLETGALIGVSFFWNCDVWDTTCEPIVVIKRYDDGKGFSQKRASRHTKAGAQQRDAVYMYGIRILVESSGIGRRFDFSLLVIQIGSMLALLRTASMASDFLMLQLYPRNRRETYYKCKVQETEDYSDLQDRLSLIKEVQEMEKKAGENVKLLGEESDGARGKSVSLGLGKGAKGGTPSRILGGSS